jgi:prepilin-type N-terminal cleavage/methylation domain-containing protein
MDTSRTIRQGFTLIELAVVVMILGILAAIAVPRLLGASNSATDATARQSVSVIRNAIEQYLAERGALPGADGQQATFKADIANYLRGAEFPTCPVGEAKNNEVRIVPGNQLISQGIGGSAATHSWAYQFTTGEFCINSKEVSLDKVTTYDAF